MNEKLNGGAILNTPSHQTNRQKRYYFYSVLIDIGDELESAFFFSVQLKK